MRAVVRNVLRGADELRVAFEETCGVPLEVRHGCLWREASLSSEGDCAICRKLGRFGRLEVRVVPAVLAEFLR